ncbi:MAG: site-specific integrase [Thermoplasmatales archaeon]|nr:site-specific integrase [Thermoplasmatales archaeon]
MNKIDEFLNNFESKYTVYTYRNILKQYFDYLQTDPEEYFNNGNDYEKDVQQYAQRLKNRPPKTFGVHLTGIKMFLMENKVELPQLFWRKLIRRKKGTRSVIEDDVPTLQQLKAILTHGGAKERAFYLTLASSGMRIGEACKIKVNDVDFKAVPTRISIRAEYTKTGNKRYVFISNEATEVLREWLKQRSEYLERAVRKSNIPGQSKSTNDPRVFPFSPPIARSMWNRMIEDAGYTETDKTPTSKKRYRIHPHSLRKMFRSKMPKELGIDITEALMGHEGYLTDVYRRYTLEELAETYMKGMHLVSIFEAQPDLTGVHDAMNQLTTENKGLQKQLNDLRMELLEVKLKQVQELQRKENHL